MKKEAAAEIVDLFLEFGLKLDASVVLVQKNSSPDEFNNYRLSVGKMMGEMLLEIMNPIFEEYPDLKPDQLE